MGTEIGIFYNFDVAQNTLFPLIKICGNYSQLKECEKIGDGS